MENAITLEIPTAYQQMDAEIAEIDEALLHQDWNDAAEEDAWLDRIARFSDQHAELDREFLQRKHALDAAYAHERDMFFSQRSTSRLERESLNFVKGGLLSVQKSIIANSRF